MDAVAQIKQRLSIVDVVGSYISLTKAGKNYKALCPFHSEDTPSFMVSPQLGIYKCFGCGASGDIFSFVQEIEGIDFYSALQKLAQRAGVSLEKSRVSPADKLKSKIYEVNALAQKFYSALLMHARFGKPGLTYLKVKRRLSMEVIKAFKLGYAPKSWNVLSQFMQKKNVSSDLLLKADLVKPRSKKGGYYDKFRDRVIFPLIDTSGKIVGFMGRTISDDLPKYLNTSTTPVFNKSKFVYGLNQNKVALKTRGAVLVEGPMDVVSAYQVGIRNVVAPLGTSLTKEHLKLLSRYTHNITLCFDSDTAGLNAIKRAIFLADPMDFDVSVVMIPAPYKDLDELLRAKPGLAEELFQSAVSVYDFFLAYVLKKYDKTTGSGKRKIVRELAQLFSALSSEVELEHYAKKVAQILDVSVSSVLSVFANPAEVPSESVGDPPQQQASLQTLDPRKNMELYFVMLLLKLGEFTSIAGYLRVVDPNMFTEERARALYQHLQGLSSSDTAPLDISAVVDTIDGRLGSLLQDLVLWDCGFDTEELLTRELESTLDRLRQRYLRKRLHDLSKQVEIAELQGNTQDLKKLVAQIEDLKNQL